MYGNRYCEILLVRPGAGVLTADVYNTYTLNECPADAWAAIDMQAVARQEQALLAVRNGPRDWLMDTVDKEPLPDARAPGLRGITMIELAHVDLGRSLATAPYVPHAVDRRTVFTFARGRKVHELIAPDGTRYVMQAWSQQVDPTLDEDGLRDLGTRLALPAGWKYRTRTLTRPLRVVTTDQPAQVLQDELMNSYSQETGGGRTAPDVHPPLTGGVSPSHPRHLRRPSSWPLSIFTWVFCQTAFAPESPILYTQ